MDLHEKVSIPRLLFIGGLVTSPAAGISAVAHGTVYIEQWNIGISEVDLPRWVLRGVTIRIGDRSIAISEDGSKIIREPSGRLLV